MDELKRKLFLGVTEKQLIQFFSSQHERGKQDELVKRYIEGFMYAGVILELATNEELTQLMEKVYFDVFGMTPIERKLQKEKGEKEIVDWSHYDTPPSQR